MIKLELTDHELNNLIALVTRGAQAGGMEHIIAGADLLKKLQGAAQAAQQEQETDEDG